MENVINHIWKQIDVPRPVMVWLTVLVLIWLFVKVPYVLTIYLSLSVGLLIMLTLRASHIQKTIDADMQDGHSVLLRPREDITKTAAPAIAFWDQAADRIPARSLLPYTPLSKLWNPARSEHIAWHLAGNSDEIGFYLTATKQTTIQTMINQLAAAWPGLQSEAAELPMAAEQAPALASATVFLKPRAWMLPLSSAASEPLTPFILSLSNLKSDRQAGLTLLLKPCFSTRSKLYQAAKTAEENKQRDRAKLLKSRLSGAWFEAVVMVHATGSNAKSAQIRASKIAADLRAAMSGDNPLKVLKKTKKAPSLMWQKRYKTYLHESDVALLAHLVGKGAMEQGVRLETAAAVICYPEEACYVPAKLSAFYRGEQALIEMEEGNNDD